MKKHAALAVLVAWGIFAGHASAQWESALSPCSGNLSYFIQHPPAYLSQPVPRTCGYSALPYSPDILTSEPQLKPATPLVIRNPYVTGSWQASPLPQRSIHAPLLIKNPYVILAKSVPPPPPPPRTQ